MTNEQAIQEVKNYDNYPNGLSKECREYIIKALEQSSDCKIFGHKENCIGTADCENCDYKIQAEQQSEDCVSREQAIEIVKNAYDRKNAILTLETVSDLPPVTPTHGTCKDCKHWDKEEEHCLHLSNDNGWFEDEYYRVYTESDFYCKDFKKRGNKK